MGEPTDFSLRFGRILLWWGAVPIVLISVVLLIMAVASWLLVSGSDTTSRPSEFINLRAIGAAYFQIGGTILLFAAVGLFLVLAATRAPWRIVSILGGFIAVLLGVALTPTGVLTIPGLIFLYIGLTGLIGWWMLGVLTTKWIMAPFVGAVVIGVIVTINLALDRRNRTVLSGGHEAEINAVAWSPDGMLVASADNSGKIVIWDVASTSSTGSGQAEIAYTLDSRRDGRSIIRALAWSPDGTTISAAVEGEIHLWDVETQSQIATLSGHTTYASGLAWSPDSRQLASTAGDDKLILWDVATGEPAQTLEASTSLTPQVAWSPDGTMIAHSVHNGPVILWDAATGEEIRRFTGLGFGAENVAWSPDSQQLVINTGVEVQLVAVDDSERRTLARCEGNLSSVAFSGNHVAAGSYGGDVCIWNLSEDTLDLPRVHKGRVFSVAFSADGTRLASASEDMTVILWDIAP